MRLLAAWILSGALCGMAAAQDLGRAGVCPGGQCPTTLAPGDWSAPWQTAPADFEVDARPIARVVNVQGQARTMGTGTLVDVDAARGWVLTCAHLFRAGAGSVVVTFPDGRSFAARLVKIDATADLAALAIRGPAIRPVELAGAFPERGDPLVSCGYGSDGRLWCNRGQALGYVTTLGSHGRETLELSGAARLGDSGGPVLNRDGHLVAVLFGTNGRVVDGVFCGRVRRFLAGVCPRFGERLPQMPPRPSRPLPGPIAPDEPSEPLVDVSPPTRPPAIVPGPASPPPQDPGVSPPKVELPPGLDPIGVGEGRLEKIAQPWLAAKLTALLISFGIPGGIAGLAAGAIVWLVMRRGKKKLQAELTRLKIRLGEPPGDASGSEPSVVERHHNQYVPYEASLLDKAWAAAHARVGEKYPGAVPYLKIVEGVKDQLLSGKDNPHIT